MTNDKTPATKEIMVQISKPSSKRLIGLLVTASAITSAIASYTIYQTPQQTSQPQATVPPVKKVTALARLEPEAEVIRISAPLNLNDDRVAKLLVKEGDRLQNGLQQAKEQVRDIFCNTTLPYHYP